MIGIINDAVRAFIVDTYGADAWAAVVDSTGIEKSFVSACPYPDEVTYKALGCLAEQQQLDLQQVLEDCGFYFNTAYIRKMGYERLLRCMGSNLVEFLKNLNIYHLHLSVSFKEMQPPAFNVDDVTPESLIFHYSSKRPGLTRFAIGLLRGAAKLLYDTDIDVTVLRMRSSEPPRDHHRSEGHDLDAAAAAGAAAGPGGGGGGGGGGAGAASTQSGGGGGGGGPDFDTFMIRFPPQASVAELHSAAATCKLALDPPTLFNLFPFHIVIDSECRLVQVGRALTRMYPKMKPGRPLSEFFTLRHPYIPFTFQRILDQSDNMFVLRSTANGMELKGQMQYMQMPAGCPDSMPKFERLQSALSSYDSTAFAPGGPSGAASLTGAVAASTAAAAAVAALGAVAEEVASTPASTCSGDVASDPLAEVFGGEASPPGGSRAERTASEGSGGGVPAAAAAEAVAEATAEAANADAAAASDTDAAARLVAATRRDTCVVDGVAGVGCRVHLQRSSHPALPALDLLGLSSPQHQPHNHHHHHRTSSTSGPLPGASPSPSAAATATAAGQCPHLTDPTSPFLHQRCPCLHSYPPPHPHGHGAAASGGGPSCPLHTLGSGNPQPSTPPPRSPHSSNSGCTLWSRTYQRLHPGSDVEPVILFLGSPRIGNVTELRTYGLFVSDLPLFDNSREMILMAEQRTAEAALKDTFERLSLQLEEERHRSEQLLYQMIPPHIADSLRRGQRVDAETYPEATILFSDIVNFTTIAAGSTAMEVCNMLDDLYNEFDALIDKYPAVYKVETIGDAYMLVANVTQPCADHVDLVLDFALDMQTVCNRVTTNRGAPIQIRVGVHTGSVVGGVVGRKMPRFHLFGDAVNTASRMESHGLAGCVHISAASRSLIRNPSKYLITERGEITVKGKGLMETFLVSRADAPAAAHLRSILANNGGVELSALPPAAASHLTSHLAAAVAAAATNASAHNSATSNAVFGPAAPANTASSTTSAAAPYDGSAGAAAARSDPAAQVASHLDGVETLAPGPSAPQPRAPSQRSLPSTADSAAAALSALAGALLGAGSTAATAAASDQPPDPLQPLQSLQRRQRAPVVPPSSATTTSGASSASTPRMLPHILPSGQAPEPTPPMLLHAPPAGHVAALPDHLLPRGAIFRSYSSVDVGQRVGGGAGSAAAAAGAGQGHADGTRSAAVASPRFAARAGGGSGASSSAWQAGGGGGGGPEGSGSGPASSAASGAAPRRRMLSSRRVREPSFYLRTHQPVPTSAPQQPDLLADLGALIQDLVSPINHGPGPQPQPQPHVGPSDQHPPQAGAASHRQEQLRQQLRQHSLTSMSPRAPQHLLQHQQQPQQPQQQTRQPHPLLVSLHQQRQQRLRLVQQQLLQADGLGRRITEDDLAGTADDDLLDLCDDEEGGEELALRPLWGLGGQVAGAAAAAVAGVRLAGPPPPSYIDEEPSEAVAAAAAAAGAATAQWAGPPPPSYGAEELATAAGATAEMPRGPQSRPASVSALTGEELAAAAAAAILRRAAGSLGVPAPVGPQPPGPGLVLGGLVPAHLIPQYETILIPYGDEEEDEYEPVRHRLTRCQEDFESLGEF